MPAPRKLDVGEFKALLNNCSTGQVAAHYGVTRQTIHRWCGVFGIVNPNKKGNKAGRSDYISKPDLERQIAQMSGEGLTYAQIAARLNRSEGHISNTVYRMKVRERALRAARKEGIPA